MTGPVRAPAAEVGTRRYTAAGILAVIIWGLSPAVLRLVGESLGLFTSGAVVNTAAGLIGLLSLRIVGGRWLRPADLRSARFLWGAVLFSVYTVTSFASTMLAVTREEVVIVTGIKFLWPLVTLLLSIPILKYRWRRPLLFGVLLSLAGVILMVFGDVEPGQMIALLTDPLAMVPVLLALISSLSWGVYSVLLAVYERKDASDIDLVGPWMLTSGLVMGLGALLLQETSHWHVGLIPELGFQIVLVSFLATWFWNISIRKGDSSLVVIVSNLLPLLAVAGTALLLGVGLTIAVGAGAALVAAGTILSKRSVQG